jgi:hypothetical protein
MRSLARCLVKLTLLVGVGALSGCGRVEQGPAGDAAAGDVAAGDATPVEVGVVPVAVLQPEQFAAASASADLPVDGADHNGAAWRVIEVPSAGSRAYLERTPSGWLALSYREFSPSAKVPPTVIESALYRSADGVHWQLIPLGHVGERLQLYSLAYGFGHYVMLGQNGDEYAIWSSTDAEHWTEQPQAEQAQAPTFGLPWGTVAHVGGLFFGLGSTVLGVSETGESWDSVPLDNTAPRAVAYGNGRYVLVGNGPRLYSDDGRTWQRGMAENVDWPSVLYADGKFYMEQQSSPDGITWDALPERNPIAYVGGHFFGWSRSSPEPPTPPRLESWTSSGPKTTLRIVRTAPAAVAASGWDHPGLLDQDAPFPDRVDVEFDDQLDCTTATCVQMGGFLFLVPPAGTAPLPDRLPRRSDGEPLLTPECPVSQMVSCDDYGARRGCECHPQAPRSPEECPEVSQFGCAGVFSPRSDEWHLPELAEAGCGCDAVDPNQPPSFGIPCVAGDSLCTAPLRCLSIEPVGFHPAPRSVCTSNCSTDADCPSWEATGFCAGSVRLRCSQGTCQPRSCQ